MSEQEALFLDLVREYEPRLRRICRIYAHEDEARKDLYQDILVQLWRALPSFRGQASPGTWLYRVALNTALDGARRRTVRRQTVVDPTALGRQRAPLPDERLEHHERSMTPSGDATVTRSSLPC